MTMNDRDCIVYYIVVILDNYTLLQIYTRNLHVMLYLLTNLNRVTVQQM